jgi:hypothetical protein
MQILLRRGIDSAVSNIACTTEETLASWARSPARHRLREQKNLAFLGRIDRRQEFSWRD